jgi:ketosteroid isomerase-like protein
MSPDDVQAWLDRYLSAWSSYDPAAIGELFAEDATYAYHPWDTGDALVRGRAAITADWLTQPDPPGSWSARLHPLLVDGDRAVATGITRYQDGKVFHNLWLLRFDAAGRCTEFVEWFMQPPRPKD